MTIWYNLHPNPFTTEDGQFRAVVQSQGTVTMEDVIERMMAFGSVLNKADATAAVNNFFTVIDSYLLDGYNVNIRGGNYKPTIKGVFTSETDSFNPSRHQIEVSISAGSQLRRVMQQAHPQKLETIEVQPNLLAYVDIVSGQRNSTLTPGGMGQLVGYRLKFDAADPAQGIFFIAADGTASRVEHIGKNSPGELMFMVPAGLTPGSYRVEVRVAASAGGQRSGQLKAALTVG